MTTLLAALLVGCQPQPTPAVSCSLLTQSASAGTGEGGNVLVILSDDIGIDKTGVYGAHPEPARTPNIDELACAGVTFTHTYANPNCTPSRAALMTGRHGSRTGLGRWIYADGAGHDLPLDELTIPEMLTESPDGYTSSAVGKWHLVQFDRDTDPLLHPNQQGFSHYAGSLANPKEATQEGNTPRGYENWEKVTNGVAEWVTTYMSTDTADDAIAQLETLPEPWFLYAAFNGAHDPLHEPPASLITEPVGALSTDLELYNAMVEATDTEIGRVIASIPEEVLARTTIVYLSDNGTPNFGIASPWESGRGKGTLYEGGVNVPMIVTGPHVASPGRTSDALVGFTDLFPTIAEIAGVSVDTLEQPIDGVSFLPLLQDPEAEPVRQMVYSEMFYPNGGPPHEFHNRMVTDGRWKLIRREEGSSVTEELYWIPSALWLEGADLMDAVDDSSSVAAAYEQLSGELDAMSEELQFAH